MPTHHDPIELLAGDDWEIPGALLDAVGAINIMVPASDTARLDPGFYTDALRIELPLPAAARFGTGASSLSRA